VLSDELQAERDRAATAIAAAVAIRVRRMRFSFRVAQGGRSKGIAHDVPLLDARSEVTIRSRD
jgi:hypothetical protein